MSGNDISRCIAGDNREIDSLHTLTDIWQGPHNAEVAELLLLNGAKLTTDHSREIFAENVYCMVFYGKEHEGINIDIYMPTLKVFAKYNLIDKSLIKSIAKFADNSKGLITELTTILEKQNLIEIR